MKRDMIKLPKPRINGITYLLAHPRQMQQVTIRELKYKNRKQNRRNWIAWQQRDACRHIHLMQTHPVELNTNILHLERLRTILDFIDTLGNHLHVLDVGCGNGAICNPIKKKENNVTCLELKGVAPLTRNCGIDQIIGGDAEEMAFPSKSFDLVLASEMVEHLWNPMKFFNEAYRILKTNGHLIISTPEGKMGLCYDSHRHYFTKKRLSRMLGKRFKLCQVKHLKANGEPAPTLLTLFQKITKN